MTREEVIKYLERHGFIADDVKDMAIEALEKQIPKKPNKHVEDIIDEYYSCPKCMNNELDDIFDNYCPRCGQALDWTEEGE